MPPVEFEPKISAGKRLQTYALDRATKWNSVGHVNTKMGVTWKILPLLIKFAK